MRDVLDGVTCMARALGPYKVSKWNQFLSAYLCRGGDGLGIDDEGEAHYLIDVAFMRQQMHRPPNHVRIR